MIRNLKIFALLTGLFYFGSLSQAQASDCSWPYCYSCYLDCNEFCTNVGFEGLYWIVHQSDLDYAVDFDANNILGPQKTHFLDYDWEVGARGWIARNWNCGWNSKIVYTYYRNESTASKDTTNKAIDLKASLLHPSTGKEDAEKATGGIDLKYQTLDFLLGKFFPYCDNSCTLRSFFGVRALKIKQDLKMLYEGKDFGTGDLATPARVKWKSDLKALGLHAGLDMTFCGLRLYGGLSGSVLASRTDNHHHQQVLDKTKKTVTAEEIDLKEKQHVMVPGYHLTGGISWETCCHNCFLFRVKVGYEYNKWFDTPQLRRYHYGNEGVSHSGSSGNIGLHGLSVTTDFYF